MSRDKMRLSLLVIAALAVSFGAASCTPPRTFADGDFNAWSGLRVTEGRSTAEALPCETDGQPAPCLSVTSITGEIIYLVLCSSEGVWDPAADGPVESVSMWLDVKSISAWGLGQGVAPAAVQGDSIYTCGYAESGAQSKWHTMAWRDLKASAFGRLSGSGAAQLDTSPGAPPIRFGFLVAQAASGEYTQYYDNWRFEVRAAPAGSAAP